MSTSLPGRSEERRVSWDVMGWSSMGWGGVGWRELGWAMKTF